MSEDSDQPLKDEAEARKDWRGEGEGTKPAASGHTFPASEDQDERMESAGGGAPRGLGRTISPPD